MSLVVPVRSVHIALFSSSVKHFLFPGMIIEFSQQYSDGLFLLSLFPVPCLDWFIYSLLFVLEVYYLFDSIDSVLLVFWIIRAISYIFS